MTRQCDVGNLRECETAIAEHLGFEQRCSMRGDGFYRLLAFEVAPIVEEASHRCRNQLKSHIVENGRKADLLGHGLDDDVLEAFRGQERCDVGGITEDVLGAFRRGSSWAEVPIQSLNKGVRSRRLLDRAEDAERYST